MNILFPCFFIWVLIIYFNFVNIYNKIKNILITDNGLLTSLEKQIIKCSNILELSYHLKTL